MIKFEKIIFLDMDGVLVNILKGIENHFVDFSSSTHHYPPTIDLHNTKNPNEIYKDFNFSNQNTFWLNFNNIRFWENLELYPWAERLIKLCLSSSYKTYVLTSPSKTATYSATGKLNFLKKHFHDLVSENRIIISNDKGILAGPNRVLIDDTIEKCLDFANNGGTSILFPQPYNRNLLEISPDKVVCPENIDKLFVLLNNLFGESDD